MKKILTLMVVVFGLTGCLERKVVINPVDIPQHNDVDWHVINSTTTDIPNLSSGKNLKQREQVERDWELGE